MWFRKTLQTSKGREIYRKENEMYIRRGAIQSDGGTLCPALADIIGQMPSVCCDERIYQELGQKVKKYSERKSPWISISIAAGIFMVVFSMLGFFLQVDEIMPLIATYLRLFGIAAVFLVFMHMRNKKTSAKQNDINRHVEQREGVTAFSFYISELRWYDPDPDIITYDAYFVSENILFSVSYDMFNSARPGDYFTGVVVDTGLEKLFYIVNYR